MQTIWTKDTEGEVYADWLNSSESSDILDGVTIHGVVSVKQSDNPSFNCRTLEITDVDGNTFEIKLFMEEV
jgi:hypothetical protein